MFIFSTLSVSLAIVALLSSAKGQDSGTCIALGQACAPIGDPQLDVSGCCNNDTVYCIASVCTQCTSEEDTCDNSEQCCGISTCRLDSSSGQKTCAACAMDGDTCTSDDQCCSEGGSCVSGNCQSASSTAAPSS